MPSWEGLNRRKFPRANFPCLVVVKKSQDKEEALLTHTENISIGGVCVMLKIDLKIFCPVEVELDLLDFEDHVRCKGKVVWNVHRKDDNPHKPLFYDVGIEFMDLETHFQKRIDDAVKHIVAHQEIDSQ